MSEAPTTVLDVMTPDPTVVAPDTPVGDAYAAMKNGGFRHLPVMEDGQLVGVVSTNDIGRLGVTVAAIRQKPVSSIMSRQVMTVTKEKPIEAVAAMMALKKVNCLPVMDDGQLIGIVTSYDLLDALARRITTGR